MEGRLYVKVRFICQGRLDLPKATIDHGTFVVPSAKVFVVDRRASTAAPTHFRHFGPQIILCGCEFEVDGTVCGSKNDNDQI